MLALCIERDRGLPQPCTEDQALLEQAKELIDQFYQEEYDQLCRFQRSGEVGIAIHSHRRRDSHPGERGWVNYRVERYLDGQF
ncbi:MAG: hypothetical protein ACLTLQ_10805 [[Clostridium] scindens]